MSVCPSCKAEVREGKAFCHNCGSPTTQSAARRGNNPSPDLFKSTVIAPPPQTARSPRPQPPPAPSELRRPAPELSGDAGAGRGARRRFFYGKFGLGIVALLLLFILGLFALAILLD